MALIRPEQLRDIPYYITGSFTGSFIGDGSQLTGIPHPVPAGPDTSVQFRDGADISGSADFTFNKVTGGATVVQFTSSVALITGSADSLFLIKNAQGTSVLNVSQSGIVVFSTQSVQLPTSPAPNGGIYFTKDCFFVGLD